MTAEYVTTTAWVHEAPFPVWVGLSVILFGGVVILCSFFDSDPPWPFISGAVMMFLGFLLCVVASPTGREAFDEDVLYRDLQAQTGILLIHQLGDTNRFIGERDGEMIAFTLSEVEETKYLLVHEGPVKTTTEGD